jgi:mono/diheme cytochrome c family protein
MSGFMKTLRSLALACAVVLAGCTATNERPPFNSPLTILELMEWVLDPAADGIWGAVGWISNAEGEREFYPKTQEEWDVVRNSAATLMEAANLLMLDHRALDRKNWMQAARRLSKNAEIALAAAKAKDVQLIFDIGAEIYNACSSCHRQYADFDKKAQAWPSSEVLAGDLTTAQFAILRGLKIKGAQSPVVLDKRELQLIAQILNR